MKYRDAKNLIKNDTVIVIKTGEALVVDNVELYGQFNIVRINCKNSENKNISVYQNEIE